MWIVLTELGVSVPEEVGEDVVDVPVLSDEEALVIGDWEDVAELEEAVDVALEKEVPLVVCSVLALFVDCWVLDCCVLVLPVLEEE
mgnify:CR=1 FL=1